MLDVRSHLGIKIYSTYVPTTDRVIANWDKKTTNVLNALELANVAVQDNKLNLIPVLITTEDVRSSHIIDDSVTQAVNWLTSFDKLGDLAMVEISRFKGIATSEEMNQVPKRIRRRARSSPARLSQCPISQKLSP
ncbi:hypothetical protein NKH89_12380 [Mesorhizobium sp. M0923]|uniref:hypothetical protein n=1 Tax=unclassified Mesorhizobium TaxID=325217 RepID=UPI0003D014EF|nr:hypothetical protein [Mesorhizobium sp. L48C026A00]ESZ05442.1 hypothetical protein X737_35600 [Mesorhizobium sp. L48C026A00]